MHGVQRRAQGGEGGGVEPVEEHPADERGVPRRRRLQLTDLATRIAWERSRLSHHLTRMSARGLVERAPSASDRRATDAVLTDAGRAALQAATPGHAALVRRMFFDGLPPAALPGLRAALDAVHEQVLASGTLPRPGQRQRRLPGLQTDG